MRRLEFLLGQIDSVDSLRALSSSSARLYPPNLRERGMEI